MDKTQELKEFERLLNHSLKRLGLIGERFTGQITLHFNDGALSDMDKLERGLRKKLIS